jgi:hypothetical protein
MLVVEGVALGRRERRSVMKDSCWILLRRRRDELDLGDKERSRTRDFVKERRAMSESAGGRLYRKKESPVGRS